MCLIIKKGATPKVAKEDIVCYKVLKKISKGDAILTPTEVVYHTGEPMYLTPFMGEDVTDEVNNNGILKAQGRISIDEMFYSFDELCGGVIHTIKTLSEAKRYAKRLDAIRYRTVMYKCVIPKGTKYYSGKTSICFSWSVADDKIASYGARKIKFVKEIPLI